MDLSTSARGRSRKRPTLPATMPYKSSEITEQISSEDPPTNTPTNMATRSFTYDTPSPSASRETRTRVRGFDNANDSPEDPTSKGGRSLRKRPRVDYTFENLDEPGTKATPATSRVVKRRKLEFPIVNDTSDDLDSRTKRRASEQPQSSSTRRRNFTRKSTAEPQTFVPEHQMDDVEVQDTIEVGGHHSSESGDSSLRRTSSGSSNNDSRALNNTSLDMLSTSRPIEYPQTNQHSAIDSPQSNHLHGLQQNVQDDEDIEGEEDAEGEDEDDIEDEEAGAMIDSFTHLNHLTPYIKGSYIYYPESPEDEIEADTDVNSEADSDEAEAEANPEIGPDTDTTTNLATKLDITNGETVQHDIVSKSATAADDQTDGLIYETPAETAANTPSAVAKPPDNEQSVKEQFRFPKLRSASDFVDLFDDVKSLSFEELYYRAEVANQSLVAWQKEFNELRKLTDDHDNSIRYQKEEEAWERKLQAHKEGDKPLVKKDFVVRGIRAENNEDTSDGVAYYRQQDKIMANAYGFQYNPHKDRVGRQIPAKQRVGLGGIRELRGRTKKVTRKLAEAEDVAPTRRTRKMPGRFTDDATVSRGSSPAPAQRRGRRVAKVQEDADLNTNQLPTTPLQAPEPAEPELPKKKGKGGRPRKNPLPEPAREPTSTPAAEPEPTVEHTPQSEEPVSPPKAQTKTPSKSAAKAAEASDLPNGAELEQDSSAKRGAEQMEEETQPARKRRRRAPATSAPAAATTPAVEEAAQDTTNGTESRPIIKPSPRRNVSRKIENLNESFNTVYSATSADQGEESRPLTSSSTATAATVVSTSNYQLREKRQKKFTNDIDDDFIIAPQPKRARTAPKKQTKIKNVTAPVEPTPAQQPEPEATPAPKATKIIKLKVPSSASTSRGHSAAPSLNPAPTHTTNNNTNGATNGNAVTNGAVDHSGSVNGAEADGQLKDYSTMTKSEKMSASMKARWNSGSMDGAVQKRRATLAAKKQNAKTPTTTTPPNNEQGQTLPGQSSDTESDDNKEGVASEQ